MLELRLPPADDLDERLEGLVLRRLLLVQEIETERGAGVVARQRLASDERAAPALRRDWGFGTAPCSPPRSGRRRSGDRAACRRGSPARRRPPADAARA